MTGSLSTLTNLQNVTGFYYFFENEVEPIKVDLEKVKFEKLTEYKRRILMYNYLPREEETPIVMGYFESFNVIKLFIPKYVKKIIPLDLEGKEYEGLEGVFYDPSNPSTIFEYNIDKYLVLLESSLGENLEEYFILLHENPLLDAHKEDFEILPCNFQEMSLVNKYLVELRYRTELLDQFNSIMISPDTSLSYLGESINQIKHDNKELSLSKYIKGSKIYGFLVNDNFSLNYSGAPIWYGEDINFKLENIFAKWLENLEDTPTKENGQWDRFQWK